MTRGAWSEHERLVIGLCAGLGMLVAAVTPFVWPDLAIRLGESEPVLALTVVVWSLPMCLALAAVVLTGRPYVAVAISLACALVGTVAFAISFFDDGLPFDALLVAQWLSWALVMASPLVLADVLAQRLGTFGPATGAAAGALAAVGVALARFANLTITTFSWSLPDRIPTSYWVTDYVGPGALLVLAGLLAGLLAGAAATRDELRQETAGVA